VIGFPITSCDGIGQVRATWLQPFGHRLVRERHPKAARRVGPAPARAARSIPCLRPQQQVVPRRGESKPGLKGAIVVRQPNGDPARSVVGLALLAAVLAFLVDIYFY